MKTKSLGSHIEVIGADQASVDAVAKRIEATARLEYLRGELRSGTMSYGELNELQSLAKYIPADDVELREAAGLPEF